KSQIVFRDQTMMSYSVATSCDKIRPTLQDHAPNQNAIHSDSTTRSHESIRRAACRSFNLGRAYDAPGYCANVMFAAARTPRYFRVTDFPVPGFADRKIRDRKLT